MFATLNLCEVKRDFTSNLREDEIESLLNEYQYCIKLLVDKDLDRARNLVLGLLDSPYLNEELESVKDIHDSKIHMLQYCVFKLVAELVPNQQLKYLFKAYEIDSSSIDLLIKIVDLMIHQGSVEDAYLLLVKGLDKPLSGSENDMILNRIQCILKQYGVKECISRIPTDMEIKFAKQSYSD